MSWRDILYGGGTFCTAEVLFTGADMLEGHLVEGYVEEVNMDGEICGGGTCGGGKYGWGDM